MDRLVRAYTHSETGAKGLKLAEDAVFLDLYGRFHRHLYAYCRRRTAAEAVEDAVAETFLLAWRKSDEIPPGDQALLWLYGVAYRVLTHQWRSASRRGRLAEKLASLGITAISLPEDTVILGQEHRQVLTALGALKDTDQEILRLTAWEELPQAEIAVVLGISIAAVRQRFYSAKKKLADEYNRLDNRKIRSPAAQKGGAW
jgi:RNA polymerase sigma-70 factor (ECF subfamily)